MKTKCANCGRDVFILDVTAFGCITCNNEDREIPPTANDWESFSQDIDRELNDITLIETELV